MIDASTSLHQFFIDMFSVNWIEKCSSLMTGCLDHLKSVCTHIVMEKTKKINKKEEKDNKKAKGKGKDKKDKGSDGHISEELK
jgi:hypothetical protein